MMDGPEASLSLVPLMTMEEHLSWAERIKPHVPHCVTMYNNLVQHGRGLVTHDTFYVLQNRPSSFVIICNKKIEATILHLEIFCLEDEVDKVIKVLGSASIMNWQHPSIVLHTLSYLLEPLQLLVEQNGIKMDNLLSCVTFTYDPQLDTEPLRVGRGLHVCRLGRAGIRHLLKNAKRGGGIPLELMYTVAQQVPYLGVYRDAALTQDTTVDVLSLPVAGDEEVPVAWICTTPSGDIGKLVVEKDFRRCGLGSLLTTALARRQAAILGFIPHAFVEADNFSSKAMFSKMAGWGYSHDSFWIQRITP